MSADNLARGEVTVACEYGELSLSITAENVAWAPDVVNDMQNRMVSLFKELLAETNKYELVGTAPEWTEEPPEDGDE